MGPFQEIVDIATIILGATVSTLGSLYLVQHGCGLALALVGPAAVFTAVFMWARS